MGFPDSSLTTQRRLCQHPHFVEGQTEAQSREVTCLRHTVWAWETRVWQTGCYGDPVPRHGALQRPLLRTPSHLKSLAKFSHPSKPLWAPPNAHGMEFPGLFSFPLPIPHCVRARGWGSRTPGNSCVRRLQEWALPRWVAHQEVGQANSKTGTTVPGPAPRGRGGQRHHPLPLKFGRKILGKTAVCTKNRRHHQHDLERKAEGEGTNGTRGTRQSGSQSMGGFYRLPKQLH